MFFHSLQTQREIKMFENLNDQLLHLFQYFAQCCAVGKNVPWL